MYSKIVLDHFQNPRNVGEIENPSGKGDIGDPLCGDFLHIFINIEDDRITEIKEQVHGCPAVIAVTSMTTELAKGKTIQKAFEITEEDVAKALGGLPEEKMHCSNLAVHALRRAIADYLRKEGRTL